MAIAHLSAAGPGSSRRPHSGRRARCAGALLCSASLALAIAGLAPGGAAAAATATTPAAAGAPTATIASTPTTTYVPSGGATVGATTAPAPTATTPVPAAPGATPTTPAATTPATAAAPAGGLAASTATTLTSTQGGKSQAKKDKGDRPLSTGAIVIAALALLLLLGCVAWALARRRAFEPHWLLALRHAIGEAGFRASATWSEFADWARLGR
jgi:hypothetical protein